MPAYVRLLKPAPTYARLFVYGRRPVFTIAATDDDGEGPIHQTFGGVIAADQLGCQECGQWLGLIQTVTMPCGCAVMMWEQVNGVTFRASVWRPSNRMRRYARAGLWPGRPLPRDRRKGRPDYLPKTLDVWPLPQRIQCPRCDLINWVQEDHLPPLIGASQPWRSRLD